MGRGLWAVGSGVWAVAVGSGPLSVDSGQWTVGRWHWALDSGQCTEDNRPMRNGQWAVAVVKRKKD